MNRKPPKLSIILLLGFGCLLVGLLGLFIWANPALASMLETAKPTAPTQEILWAPMAIEKPTNQPLESNVVAPQVQGLLNDIPTDAASIIQSVNPVLAATETPGTLLMEIVGDASADPAGTELEQPSAINDDLRWIEVDLSEQRTYAYEGDTLVNSFIVSTGLPATPTVTGDYSIYIKIPVQDMSGPGYYLRDVPWVMYFYDEYGFHGTYWHNNFGTPMSRGCVNLTIDDAKWLYDWASVGTRVNVHQ